MSEEGSRGPPGLLSIAPELDVCGGFFELCKRENVDKADASPRSWQRAAYTCGAASVGLSLHRGAQETRTPLPWLWSLSYPLTTGDFEPTS